MINREVLYERNLTGSFIKIPASYQGEFDEKMMLRKKIPGMISVEKCFYNGEGRYWYDITGFQSLETKCQIREPDYGFIEKLLLKVCNQLETLELNLISPETLLMDPEYIFIDNNSREIRFMMYPGVEGDVIAHFRELMEFLLVKTNHADPKQVQNVYALYELMLNQTCSVADIRMWLENKRQSKLKEEIEAEKETEKKETNSDFVYMQTKKQTKKQTQKQKLQSSNVGRAYKKWIRRFMEFLGLKTGDYQIKDNQIDWKAESKVESKEESKAESKISSRRDIKKDFRVKLREKRKGVQDDFLVDARYMEEEVQAEPEYYPTICITATRKSAEGILKYEGDADYEDIHISSKEMRIGKGRNADIRIENDTISHIHAKIIKEDGAYYLEDLNSTNGTFINDEMLQNKEKYKLNIGDRIQFADMIYRFG
ncbi:MAG: FHA domain-containing protein [Lachnospiraceae bacterium]|nr:FHA domain-containing protein [Lachnospiraceae bacterium]